jgi:hypothetical protein
MNNCVLLYLQIIAHVFLFFISEPSAQIGFDNSGKYLLSAGDKHVHVLHNITGKSIYHYYNLFTSLLTMNYQNIIVIEVLCLPAICILKV